DAARRGRPERHPRLVRGRAAEPGLDAGDAQQSTQCHRSRLRQGPGNHDRRPAARAGQDPDPGQQDGPLMNRFRQLGQSMTEYMVVLGVTGAALLAATTDVSNLFDNVQRGYRTQSSEMNKVQQYDRYKVSFNANEPGDGDYDDGDTPPADDTELPDVDEQLPSIEW